MAYSIPANVWTSWNRDPAALLLLALATALYVRGFVRARRRRVPTATSAWRAGAFVGGLLLLFVAAISPLDRLTLALLWVHMVQYTLLTVPVPLLLVLGRPVSTMRWALTPATAGRLRRLRSDVAAVRVPAGLLSRPAVIGVLDVAALLVWHVPRLQEATLASEPLHLLQLASFLGVGLLFWWMIGHPQARPTMGYARVLVTNVATSLVTVFLGMVLYAVRGAAYPAYAARAAAWGMSAHADQQLAGVIVGVVPTFFDSVPVAYILARWINWSELAEEHRP